MKPSVNSREFKVAMLCCAILYLDAASINSVKRVLKLVLYKFISVMIFNLYSCYKISMIVYLNFARCYRNKKNFHIFPNKILNCWPKKPKDKILILLKTL